MKVDESNTRTVTVHNSDASAVKLGEIYDKFAINGQSKFEVELQVIMRYGIQTFRNPLKIGVKDVAFYRSGLFKLD